MLRSFQIQLLVDVRHFPGSRKFPQYNKESLAESLPAEGIQYRHLVGLGGRRKTSPDSRNKGWRSASFRGYADYMETPGFEAALDTLKKLAMQERVAYMCSEAVWWRCHRSLISDRLKSEGWEVWHIMDTGKAQLHPYTAPAVITEEGCLTYPGANELWDNAGA